MIITRIQNSLKRRLSRCFPGYGLPITSNGPLRGSFCHLGKPDNRKKYIIVAKDVYAGTSGSDTPTPLEVTEICSELIITRLYLIDLLKTGKITLDDTVVTIGDRTCLYTNIFKNVMTFKEFSSIKINNIDNVVIDLLNTKNYSWLAVFGGIKYKPFYQNYERDKEEIMNVNFSNLKEYNIDKSFVALVIRKRGAWPEKNLPDEYWAELIHKLKTNGIQVFVFGKETKSFTDGHHIQYVKNYRDWCSLVKNSNCKHIVSTMTGGVYPALIFGAPKMQMTIIDNTNLMTLHAGDPSFYDSCVNFAKVEIEFINKIPKTEELCARISKSL